jgi:tetratricopeptide (TPR) repeat protein
MVHTQASPRALEALQPSPLRAKLQTLITGALFASALVVTALAAHARPAQGSEPTTTVLGNAATTARPQVLAGTLDVQGQTGLGCSTQPRTPYQLPVQAVSQPDGRGWIIWGAMQTMLARTAIEGGALQLQVLGENRVAGQLQTVTPSSDTLHFDWRESALPGGLGCVYASATLRLNPVGDPAAADISRRQAAQLLLIQALEERLLNTTDRGAAAAVIQEIPPELLSPPSAEPMASQQRAQAVPAGDRADRIVRLATLVRAKGQPSAALALSAYASHLYRTEDGHPPEFVVQALLNEARLRHRLKGLPQAMPLMAEAVELLRNRNLLHSESSADTHALLGAWLMRAGSFEGARSAFSTALEAHVQRGASGSELATARNNLAHALAQLGQHDAAIELWQRALTDAAADMPDAASIASTIRESLNQARSAQPHQRGA